MAVGRIHRPFAVALGVEGGREPGTERGVLDDRAALAVGSAVLVVADADVEAPVLVEAPRIVDEAGVGTEAVALGPDEDRRPADEGPVVEHREQRRPLDDHRRRVHAVVRARLVVVGEALVVEQVEAEHDVVRAQASGRREVGGLGGDVLVVAPLVVAHAAERRRVVAGGVPRLVEHQRALDQVRELRARMLEREAPPGVLPLHEELGADDPGVVGRQQVLRRRAVHQAVEVHDVAEEVPVFGVADLRIGALERVVAVEGPGQLAFAALLVTRIVEVEVGRERRARRDPVSGHPPGPEEPQPVLDDGAAQRRLLRVDHLVGPLVVGIGRQLDPLVVVEGRAVGAGELVPPRLGDRLDDAALEAAVLSRDGGGGDCRLL